MRANEFITEGRYIPTQRWSIKVDGQHTVYSLYRTAVGYGARDEYKDEVGSHGEASRFCFYSPQERDEFIKYCKDNGLNITYLDEENNDELGDVQINSPVPSPSFRDIDVFS